jgi:hypothetical protein
MNARPAPAFHTADFGGHLLGTRTRLGLAVHKGRISGICKGSETWFRDEKLVRGQERARRRTKSVRIADPLGNPPRHRYAAQ